MPPKIKKKKLSQEELEVHQILSPDDSVSTASAPTAHSSRDHVTIKSSMRPVHPRGAEALQTPVNPQAPVTMSGMKELF